MVVFEYSEMGDVLAFHSSNSKTVLLPICVIVVLCAFQGKKWVPEPCDVRMNLVSSWWSLGVIPL